MVAEVRKNLFFGGNWKALMTPTKTRKFLHEFGGAFKANIGVLGTTRLTTMIAPPSACLRDAREVISGMGLETFIALGVQNPWHRSGAYTGATTFEMAADQLIGAKYAIIGHSENREPLRMIGSEIRRIDTAHRWNDPEGSVFAGIAAQIGIDAAKPKPFRLPLNQVVNQLVKESLLSGITPILCVGETLEERNIGRTMQVVLGQLMAGLQGLTPEQIAALIIAYEPVWAIGTGVTATSEQAQEVHAGIKKFLVETTGDPEIKTPKIYGGSMTKDNVAELVTQPDIDGGLVGGASLKPDEFTQLLLNGVR